MMQRRQRMPARSMRSFRSKPLSWLLLGSMFLAGFSCAHVRPSGQYVGPQQMSPALLAYYSYPKRPIEARVQVLKQKKRYDVLRIEFPSAINVFGNEDIKVDYYGSVRE